MYFSHNHGPTSTNKTAVAARRRLRCICSLWTLLEHLPLCRPLRRRLPRLRRTRLRHHSHSPTHAFPDPPFSVSSKCWSVRSSSSSFLELLSAAGLALRILVFLLRPLLRRRSGVRCGVCAESLPVAKLAAHVLADELLAPELIGMYQVTHLFDPYKIYSNYPSTCSQPSVCATGIAGLH